MMAFLAVPRRPSISPAFAQQWSTTFVSHAGGKAYLTGIEAASIFLTSGLDKTSLSRIWEEADSTHDGRFSHDEFVHAMWLIESQGGGTQSPALPAPPQYSTALQYSAAPQCNTASQPPGLEMQDALVCVGCDTGIVDEDTVHHCPSCEQGKHVRCVRCGPGCAHQGQRSLKRVVPSPFIKAEDKDGDLGFSGLKCRACKAKFQVDMLVWHCRRCLEDNLCRACWPYLAKRCRHAARGKVEVRRIKLTSLGEVVEDIQDIHDMIGG